MLGSGGHTAEMLALIKELDFEKYNTLYFVAADTDTTSIPRVVSYLEKNKPESATAHKLNVSFHKIRRSREVGQSWLSSAYTTLVSLFDCLRLVYSLRPDLVICNGPGTCVPICIAALFFRALHMKESRIVFVESFCRVQSLSLTGKIVYYLVDRFVVQWPGLGNRYSRAEYIGTIF